MTYQTENAQKASFDDVYAAPTPHAYVGSMAEHNYEIGERARPYCVAAADLLREKNGEMWPVQLLDVGCSYGIGSAFVKYGCSFDEIVAFFASRAPTEYWAACEATRQWLHVVPPACDVRCVGLDRSAPAIRFASDANLLDGGIARDFEEENAAATPEEKAWFRSCNLFVSTGAIGYLSERTLRVILPHLGQDHPGAFGPIAVLTILRMFDSAPVIAEFEAHGFHLRAVPEVLLPQRNFVDDAERDHVLDLLHTRGLDTANWEDQGKLFADLYVAASPRHIEPVLHHIRHGGRELALLSGA